MPLKMTTQKPKSMKKSFKVFAKSLKPWGVALIVAVLLAGVAAVLSIFGPKILGNITTEAVNSYVTTGSINWDSIGKSALLLLILFIIS